MTAASRAGPYRNRPCPTALSPIGRAAASDVPSWSTRSTRLTRSFGGISQAGSSLFDRAMSHSSCPSPAIQHHPVPGGRPDVWTVPAFILTQLRAEVTSERHPGQYCGFPSAGLLVGGMAPLVYDTCIERSQKKEKRPTRPSRAGAAPYSAATFKSASPHPADASCACAASSQGSPPQIRREAVAGPVFYHVGLSPSAAQSLLTTIGEVGLQGRYPQGRTDRQLWTARSSRRPSRAQARCPDQRSTRPPDNHIALLSAAAFYETRQFG